jgi:3-methylcrotonyl-CoA carboxylase alpha subunit
MFEKVLIANRGEVARRIIRTCRRLGVRTVAVYSDADADSLAVSEADEAHRLGEAPLAKSYLDVEALLGAVRASGADAVHPGYGLLSENAGFASAVRARGVTFIGPETAALETFGDKLAARALARSLGVEPPPGSDDAVDASDAEALQRALRQVGLPLIVKAAGGGGGIGMLRVDRAEDLAKAVATCSQRGQSAFSNPKVYLERYLERPRHIEVQVLATSAGQAWALGERECSVQRRHQKLIEETPSPAAFLSRPGARERLLDAALRIVTSQSYVGLATVEFVVDASDTPYFLEVNPRLQVEHGITDQVFGVDLVELQLRASAGDPVPTVPTDGEGHAVEVRLYAEDPDRGFIPQPGVLEAFRFPAQDASFRVDTGFREGDVVTPYYDPLLAKVMAHGGTRQEAIDRLLHALAQTEIRLTGKTGPKRSNLELMRELLESPRFVSGQYTTHLIEDLTRERTAPSP